MNANREIRLLVPIDCSDQSQDTVAYLGGVLAGSQAEVVLFHVLSKLPDSYYDISDLAVFQSKMREIAAWDWKESNKSHLALEKAKDTLVLAGLAEEAVKIDMHDRQEGVARDILKQCQRGYTAVVIGRRGMSPIKDLLLGSTATKLITNLNRLPVWVVGGRPESRGYVVGIDGSEGCLRAVRHLAAFIRHQKEARVKLVNVVRRLGIPMEAYGAGVTALEAEGVWEDSSRQAAGASLAQAENILVDAGIDAGQIDCKVITGALSRAESLVEEAVQAGCGTLVMGRRGLSKIEAFVMGRVTNKVLSLCKDKAVWIVH